jgi:PGF-CTERM protein
MKGKILKLFAFGFVLVLLLSGMQAGVPATIQAKDDSDYGLVAVWHFDEGSGTVAKDASGHGNDGTIHGATWTTGISGKALRFDGSNDYVEVPYSMKAINTISMEAWIYPKQFDGEIISKWDGTGNGVIHFELCPDRTMRMGLRSGLTAYIVNFRSTETSSLNQWVHVVETWDGKNAKIYFSGAEVGSASGTGTIRHNENMKYWIGSIYGTDRFFNGLIDEVCIYNRVLSAEEIEAHYLARRAGGSAEDSASNLIKSVSSRIDVLKRNNVDTSLIEEALKNAQNAYDLEKYDESCELAQSALKMADNAYEAVQHIESAQSEIDDAKSIGADVKDAEKKLKEARDALNKGNYEYAEDWADDALQLAKHASVGSVSIKELKALATKYDERTVAISGTIRDIETVYGEGYRFAIDDGSGMISVVYQGSFGDINDGDKVKASGVFQASVGTVVAENVRESGGIPGFEAIFAIAGLLVVAYILRRKR